jgi:hypothetical protein
MSTKGQLGSIISHTKVRDLTVSRLPSHQRKFYQVVYTRRFSDRHVRDSGTRTVWLSEASCDFLSLIALNVISTLCERRSH